MRHYEVNFIVDPVLSGDEVKSTAENIQKDLEALRRNNCPVDEMGLRQLAYQINKTLFGRLFLHRICLRSSRLVGKFELSLKRNERLTPFPDGETRQVWHQIQRRQAQWPHRFAQKAKEALSRCCCCCCRKKMSTVI
jgi:ribosomal protein S6